MKGEIRAMTRPGIFLGTLTLIGVSGCSPYVQTIPGLAYDTPQPPITPITMALQCSNTALRSVYSQPQQQPRVFVIYLDGFYDGTQTASRTQTKGALASYFEREFARALVRFGPSEQLKVMYHTPESPDTVKKYFVGDKEMIDIQNAAKIGILGRQATGYFLVRGTFTQSDDSPQDQSGGAANASIRKGIFAISPNIARNASDQTVALTVDIANVLTPYIGDSNTLLMSFGGNSVQGGLNVTIRDQSFGFTFQDEMHGTLQSAQRTLVEAAAFSTLNTLFGDKVDLTPCVTNGKTSPAVQTKLAVEWNGYSPVKKKQALISALQAAGYYHGNAVEIDDDEYHAAIERAQSEMFKKHEISFPFSEKNLGLLFLRLRTI